MIVELVCKECGGQLSPDVDLQLVTKIAVDVPPCDNCLQEARKEAEKDLERAEEKVQELNDKLDEIKQIARD